MNYEFHELHEFIVPILLFNIKKDEIGIPINIGKITNQ